MNDILWKLYNTREEQRHESGIKGGYFLLSSDFQDAIEEIERLRAKAKGPRVDTKDKPAQSAAEIMAEAGIPNLLEGRKLRLNMPDSAPDKEKTISKPSLQSKPLPCRYGHLRPCPWLTAMIVKEND